MFTVVTALLADGGMIDRMKREARRRCRAVLTMGLMDREEEKRIGEDGDRRKDGEDGRWTRLLEDRRRWREGHG